MLITWNKIMNNNDKDKETKEGYSSTVDRNLIDKIVLKPKKDVSK